MFTTGSKLFFGASALALVSALVVAACTDGPLSSAGVLGLLSVMGILAFLGGVNYANRDCNVSGMDEAAAETAAAAHRAGAQNCHLLDLARLHVGADPRYARGLALVALDPLLEVGELGVGEPRSCRPGRGVEAGRDGHAVGRLRRAGRGCAGAAQLRVKKYSSARVSTSAEDGESHTTRRPKGHCIRMSNIEKPKANISPCIPVLTISRWSPLPNA